MTESLKELSKITDKPFGGYANSETVEIDSNSEDIHSEEDHWDSATSIDEEEYSNEAMKWVEEGATIIAGCCRTRPSHIKELVKKLTAY